MKQKNILAVVPWIYDFAAFDLWLQPLGLLRLSTELKNLGFQVNFINCMDRYDSDLLRRQKRTKPKGEQQYGCGRFTKEEVEKPDIIRSVKRPYFRYGFPVDLFEEKLSRVSTPPDAVLISQTMTYWYPGTQLAVKKIKEHFPASPVILGGIYPILMPEHARRTTGADHVFSKSSFDGALSFILKVLGMEKLKTKTYAFSDIPRIDYTYLSDLRSIVLETGRGCPYKCSYCSHEKIHKGMERKSPGKVLEDIFYYKETFHSENFAFYDDALAHDRKKHLNPILEGIVQRGLPDASFHTPNGFSVKEIDTRLAELLYAARFKTLRLSLETSLPEKQKMTGGKVTNSQFERAVAHLNKAGFHPWEVEVYMMIGLPGQNLEEVQKDITYVFDKGAVPVLTSYSPTPGSVYYDVYFKETMQDPLLHNNTIFSLKTPDMDEEGIGLLRKEIRRKKRIFYPDCLHKR